jgi:hypothetical protein
MSGQPTGSSFLAIVMNSGGEGSSPPPPPNLPNSSTMVGVRTNTNDDETNTSLFGTRPIQTANVENAESITGNLLFCKSKD